MALNTALGYKELAMNTLYNPIILILMYTISPSGFERKPDLSISGPTHQVDNMAM